MSPFPSRGSIQVIFLYQKKAFWVFHLPDLDTTPYPCIAYLQPVYSSYQPSLFLPTVTSEVWARLFPISWLQCLTNYSTLLSPPLP